MVQKSRLDDFAELENPSSETDELNKLIAIQVALAEATKIQTTSIDFNVLGSIRKTLEFIDLKIEIMKQKAEAELEMIPGANEKEGTK